MKSHDDADASRPCSSSRGVGSGAPGRRPVDPAEAARAERDLREALIELGAVFGRFNMETEPEPEIWWVGRQPDQYAEPSTPRYAAPRFERWFIARIAHLVAWRLVHTDVDHRSRTVLARLLFGLQRFPRVTPGLTVTVSWGGDYDDGMVQFGSEGLTFQHCSNRLQYFVGSHHLFELGTYLLQGEKRARFLVDWVGCFDALADKTQRLRFEDLSSGHLIDRPPVWWPGASPEPVGRRSIP